MIGIMKFPSISIYVVTIILFRYSDLLALAEDLDEIKTTRVLRGRKSSVITVSPKSKSKKPIEVHEITDSSSDSSEVGLSYVDR